MIPQDTHLQIGSLLFEGLDQIDLTGPFEVLSRIPNSTHRIFGKTIAPVRDVRGLRLTADAALAQAPQLDLLHVPGGFGQEALMDDEDVLAWIRRQAAGARSPPLGVHWRVDLRRGRAARRAPGHHPLGIDAPAAVARRVCGRTSAWSRTATSCLPPASRQASMAH